MYSSKIIFLLLVSLFSALPSVAQTETLGILTYTPPPGWQREATSEHTKYTEIKNQSSYCILALYNTRESSGDPGKDFEKEWTDLAVKPFQAVTSPDIQKQTAEGGWNVMVGASAFKFQGSEGLLMLTVISGNAKTASIISLTNDTSYLNFIEEFLGAIDVKAEKTAMTPANDKGSSTLVHPKIPGTWAKSSSSPFSLDPSAVLTNQGYYKGQYNLKSDGSYTFHGESWRGYLRSNNYTMIEESGSYTADDKQLTLSPRSSKLVSMDKNGKARRTDQLSLEKRIYQWQLLYFEGLKETNLVLTPGKPHIVDGSFAGNTDYSNSYLYSREYKPEWKFAVR